MRPHATITENARSPLYRWALATLLSLKLVFLLFLGSAALAQVNHAEMDAQTAYQAAQSGDLIILDIRTPAEWRQTGLGAGVVGLDMTSKDFLRTLVAIRQANPARPIALICATGVRSGHVSRFLDENSFGNMVDISEGMMGSDAGTGWLKKGLPTVKANLSDLQAELNAVLYPTN